MTAPTVDAGPLIDAIEAAVTAAGVAIAEGRKPAVTPGRPYIVAFYDSGAVTDRTLRSRDGFSLYCSFQCAGLTPEAVRVAVRKLRDALLGLHLAEVGDRTVLMPTHEAPRPMDRDDDADPALFIQVDEWRIRLA